MNAMLQKIKLSTGTQAKASVKDVSWMHEVASWWIR